MIVVGPFAEGQQIEIQSLRTTGFMSRQPYAYHTVAGRHVATVGRRHPRAAPHDRAAHNRGPAGNARSAPRRLAAPAGYRMIVVGPRLGTLLGTLRLTPMCAFWAHVVMFCSR